MKAFECEVDVWSYDPREYRAGPMAPYVTVLFDTQCQRSNWIAQNIVKESGVLPVRLSKDEEFVTSNGQVIKAFLKITLWFGNIQIPSSKGSNAPIFWYIQLKTCHLTCYSERRIA